MDHVEWNNTFSQIQRNGVLLNENVFKENFHDVVNKAFDKELGFGYISDNGYKPRARVILQGKNPFIDNHTGLLSPVMEGHLPYSQVYNLAWGGDSVDDGTTYCILRHFLHVPSLSGEEVDSIKVATCRVENMESIDYNVSSFENGDAVVERKCSVKEEITEENYSTTEGFVPGQVVLTVHKAKDIEKKGFVGKADPYVLLTYGTQKEKSATVNNNQNPVWHITGYFDVEEQSSNEITIEVFDDDSGKDDFLGKTIVDIQEICKSKESINKWIPLTKCKSGEILISAKFIPLPRIARPVGHISLTLHQAKKIEKKKMMKKADPYVLIKLGEDRHRTKTVNNSQNPTWNYVVELDVTEASPRQISFEVFDDDIGNDAPLGNVTLDLDTLMQKQNLESQWNQLENCKSGQLMISAKFTPSPAVVEIEADINNTEMSVKKEIITEHLEGNKAVKELMEEPSSVVKNISHPKLENGQNQTIEFVDPIYSDDQFVVVEKKENNWFMVVSPHQNLPINVNLVPFKQHSEPNSPIFIYALPKGGFHNTKRVVHSGKGLAKCGHEKACVLRAGEPYQFWTDTHGKNFNLGNLKTETFGPDKSWVVYKPEYFQPQDYIEASLKKSEQAKPLFSGPISLYDTLNVDAA